MNLHSHVTIETARTTTIQIPKKDVGRIFQKTGMTDLGTIFKKLGVIANDENYKIIFKDGSATIIKTRVDVEVETGTIRLTDFN